MLYFLVAWTALLVACMVIGTALLQQFQLQHFVRVGDRLIASEWMGIIVLANSLLLVSLAIPLSPIVGIGVALLLGGSALLLRSVRTELANLWQQVSWQRLLGYLALVVIIAAMVVRPVTWIDSGLYHYGVVQWLGQYGTVTGIALIFSNLGFVSSWFALSAPLNPPILEARVSAVANGFVLMVVVLQLVIYLSRIWRGKAQPSDGFGTAFFGLMLLVVGIYNLLSDIAISPSPDLPATFLVGMVAWAMLVIMNAQSAGSGSVQSGSLQAGSLQSKSLQSSQLSENLPTDYSQTIFNLNDCIVPFLLSVGAVTIKLTTLSLLLVSSLFYLVYSRRSFKQLFWGGAIGLLLLAPLLIASVKASGCPLYPASALCLDVPWGPNKAAIAAVAQNTHGWTNWFGDSPTEQTHFLWVLGKWLQSDRANQAWVGLLGINILGLACSVKPLLNSPVRGQGWVIAVGVSGVIFLMMTAPFFRFVLPYLLLIPSLLILVWVVHLASPTWYSRIDRLHRLAGSKDFDRTTVIASLALIPLTLAVFLHAYPTSHLLLPPPMQTVAVVQKQVNDLTYFSPQVKGELCWATLLPCGFEVENVKLRDADRGLAGGFVRQDVPQEN